jgi:TetR/AcrR family transcriptional repressor of nem operon
MGRPREFEANDAIEKAMQVFWKHGYEEASLPDLLEGMGLTRGSLYKAFKDKKNLFLLVLDRYEAAAVDAAVDLLVNPSVEDGADRILLLFESVIRAVTDADCRGCLLCTATATSAADDPDIADAVHRGLAKMQSGFIQAMQDTPSLNNLDQAAKLRLGDVMLTQYIGLRVLARSRVSLGVLEQSRQGIEDILRAAAK